MKFNKVIVKTLAEMDFDQIFSQFILTLFLTIGRGLGLPHQDEISLPLIKITHGMQIFLLSNNLLTQTIKITITRKDFA